MNRIIASSSSSPSRATRTIRTVILSGMNGSTKPSRPTRIWARVAGGQPVAGDFKIRCLPTLAQRQRAGRPGLSSATRDATSSHFVRANNGHPFNSNGDPSSYLASTNLSFIDYYNFPGSFVYSGEQTIDGFYGMGEWSALEWLQVIGGARFEKTDLSVTTDNRKAPARLPESGAIKQTDITSSLGVVVSLEPISAARFVVRDGAPGLHELQQRRNLRYRSGRTYLGNPNLKMSSSENFPICVWNGIPAPWRTDLSSSRRRSRCQIEQGSFDVNNELIRYEITIRQTWKV